MMTDENPDDRMKPVLSAAAKRALAEAAERRAEVEAQGVVERPRELQGRRGPEPTRYGDWESKGIISDF